MMMMMMGEEWKKDEKEGGVLVDRNSSHSGVGLRGRG